MMVGTKGVDMVRAFRGPNRAEDAANGPLSFFAQRNPILNLDFENGGIAFDWQFAPRASVQAIYSARDIANPGKRAGLFDGNTTAAAQLLLTPAKTFDVGLYYVNNYSPNGSLFSFAGDSCLTAVNCFAVPGTLANKWLWRYRQLGYFARGYVRWLGWLYQLSYSWRIGRCRNNKLHGLSQFP